MRHIHDLLGHRDVVVVIGNRLAVFFERAVHHHTGKSQVNRTLTNLGRLTMILMHHNGDMGIGLDRCLNEVFQEAFASVFTRTCGGLHDDRAVSLSSRFHDGLDLFQVVHVKCGNAITMLCGVVEKLAHGN